MLYAQEMTIYGVLDELDKLLSEAYESKTGFTFIPQQAGSINVVDLMYALGSCDKDDEIYLLTNSGGPEKLSGYANNEGKIYLTGTAE